ncbi:Mitogen-activated protein kinase kinase kinase 3 [Bienertia sinuspersici]
MAVQQKTLTLSPTSNTMKFLYSYGGKIRIRPSDGRLRYIGGFTRVVSVPRSISFSDLIAKLEDLCGYTVNLRCQLPNEDLDVLVSIKSDDDLINVIEVYDNASENCGKELKIRAILSQKSSSSAASSSLSASPASSSSSLSSMSPDRSPTHCDRRRFNQKPPMPTNRLSSPANRGHYGVVRDCYYYHPCHVQANFQPPPYFLQNSKRLH